MQISVKKSTRIEFLFKNANGKYVKICSSENPCGIAICYTKYRFVCTAFYLSISSLYDSYTHTTKYMEEFHAQKILCNLDGILKAVKPSC